MPTRGVLEEIKTELDSRYSFLTSENDRFQKSLNNQDFVAAANQLANVVENLRATGRMERDDYVRLYALLEIPIGEARLKRRA